MNVQIPTPQALAWLDEQRPRALARRLVAQGTHDEDVAATVEAVIDECAELWDTASSPTAAIAAIYDPGAGDRMWLRQQSLLTAATVANWPLWTSDQPDPGVTRELRLLGPVEVGTVRCVARTVPARLVPVALADAGVIPAQQVPLATGHFRRHDDVFDVEVRASDRGTIDRTVTLGLWATQGTQVHLDDCRRRRRLRPCYGGHAESDADRAKAVAARIDRVLAAADVHATAGSIRLTAGLRALEAAGPVAAMQTLGSNSIPATLAYLNR